MSASGLGARPPRRLWGRKRREWEARAAQAAAADAFARMDQLQRELRARFAAGGGEVAPPGFADLDAATDVEARRYLQTQDQHPVASQVDKPALLAAAMAYRQAAFDCASQADRLAEFGRRHSAGNAAP